MLYLIVVTLILLSGLFSGLTLGLLSLDQHELKRKIALGDAQAKKVYPIRKRGNLLLSTLLLGNVAVNSTLAIFLGNIASGLVAGFAATGLILIFGEIVPQAVLARHALRIGAQSAWLVRLFIILFFPICWPIAWVLDKFLGAELPTVYSKKELMKIVEEHEDSHHSDVDQDEERIIMGALSFSEKQVHSIMTPADEVYALEVNSVLDDDLLDEIRNEGYTRIPVFKGTLDSMVGVLYSKDLINVDEDVLVKDVYRKKRKLIVSMHASLDAVLNTFIQEKTHLAFVENRKHKLVGVVSLEDVIEEVLRLEILDETDQEPGSDKGN